MTRLRTAVIVVMTTMIAAGPIIAQQNSQVKQLLQRFKNWRYGMVSVYKVSEEDGSVNKLNVLLGPKEPELTDEAKTCKQRDEVESLVLTGGEGMDEKEIKKVLSAPGCKAYEKYFTQRTAWERAQFKKAYIVTTRRTGNDPVKVIGLLVQKSSESYYGIKDDLDPPTDIYLEAQLKSYELDQQVLVDGVVKKAREVLEGTSSPNLLDYLSNQVVQGNFENVTPEAQGIGEEGISFVAKKYGNTTGLTEDDVQQYIRISEGLPQDYQNNNEVIVSLADGVSYRRYERSATASASGGEPEVDTTRPTNANLPKYGVELRYGLEEINYPSLWSERLSLNALWGSSRLGVVLPTSGWSSLATEFGNTRTMTNAGMGVNGSFDFPIRVIDASGVFNMSASYVFDDANMSNHMILDTAQGRYEDYLVRFHASVQYSFAVKIDKDFMFRMRLGGTIYGMESWANVGTNPDSLEYKKVDEQTVGGVSGRIEFMTTGWSTPVGFTLSYFDEAILGKAWLQVPVIDQFALRLDASVFTPVFRDPRAWETNAVVMPSLHLIFNF